MDMGSVRFKRRPVRTAALTSIIAIALVTGTADGSQLRSSRAPLSVTTHEAPIRLSGAGSTFDAPFFATAFADFERLYPNISIHYAAVSSGEGIRRFSLDAVNFGASDVPMTGAEQSRATGGTIVQVPVALGAVVISYNVPSLGSTPLRLSGPVLAQIYLGQIMNWNDPSIRALNPGISIPDEAITVVHRSDGSGTTYIFTNYLSTVSSEWSSGPGTNKSITWPTGYGGMGSSGVAALLKRIPGAIGYFELNYAESQTLPYAAIENRAGAFVPPFTSNVAADAAMKTNVSASDFSIVNEPGKQSYPISGYSWLLIYLHQSDRAVGTALVKLATWLTHAGQSQALATDYVPLPQNIRNLARRTVSRIVVSMAKS